MSAPKRRQEWWRAKAAIDALIDADAFDAAATEALSHRRSYGSAASCLLEIINCPARDLIPAFLKSQTFAP
jgi:hypothetical protein